jgi:hypothetical protein
VAIDVIGDDGDTKFFIVRHLPVNAGVAKLADAQDLKS